MAILSIHSIQGLTPPTQGGYDLKRTSLVDRVTSVARLASVLFLFFTICNKKENPYTERASLEKISDSPVLNSNTYFESSGEEFNNWSETLSVFPRRPSQTHPINPNLARQWIYAHSSYQQSAAEKFIQSTQHINQTVFERTLESSVWKFNSWLLTQPSEDYCIFTTKKESKKSNRWVAELALPLLLVPPKQIFSYRTSYDAERGLDQMTSYMSGKNITTIVLFDDASYSGSQTSETNEGITEYLSDHFPQNFYKIVWIIPFITEIAQDIIYNNIFNIGSDILLFHSQILPPLGAFLSTSECKALKIDCSKPAVYFDHKISDQVSSFEFIYRYGQIAPANVYMEGPKIPFIEGLEIIPPYHVEKNLHF